MFTRLLALTVSLTAVASGVFAPAAIADKVDMGLQAVDACRLDEQPRRDRRFLQQITNPQLYTADHPPVLNSDSPKNMLVTIKHHKTFVCPQSGSAFERPYAYQHIITVDSSISDSESPVISAGGSSGASEWTFRVWRALIRDGCSNPPAAIPIDFRDVISLDPDGPGGPATKEQVAEFHATDNTTLNGPGIWNYQYAVDAYFSDGSTAVIDTQGTVSVTCTPDQNL